jgi:hypothetical protein
MLLSLLSFGQNSKWSTDIVGTPNFYHLKKNEVSTKDYNSTVGLSLGMETYYNLRKKIDVGLGVHYRTLSYQVDYNYKFRDYGDPQIPRRSDLDAQYIDIPLIVRYEVLSKGAISIAPSLGFNSSFLIYSKQKTTFEDNSIRDLEFLNTTLFSSSAGIGVSYKISDKIALILEPRFSYYFDSLDQLSSANTTLFQSLIGVKFSY